MIYLKDLINDYPNETIVDWEYIQVNESIRLYYKQHIGSENQSLGFYFHSVLWCSNIVGDFTEEDYDDWKNTEELEVESFIHGIAYWDEIRHMYFGSEQSGNYGYYYCPNMDNYIATMNVLKELQNKYCQEKYT